MPLPLIPVVSALAAGGTLVPHAAGGMIVTSAVGYVAGTYLSTAAIGGLLAAASTALGAGALYLTGAAGGIIGSAGIFGTTVGSSGITGALMSAGIISSTPLWMPLAVGSAAAGGAAGLGYGGYRLYQLKKKIENAPKGEEAQFTETEAKIIEKIIKRLSKKEDSDNTLLGSKNMEEHDGCKVRKVLAEISLLPTETSGRTTGITSGYRPSHNFGKPDSPLICMGSITMASGTWINPGESKDAEVLFTLPKGYDIALYQGLEWRIHEGSRHVGSGRIKQVFEDESPK